MRAQLTLGQAAPARHQPRTKGISPALFYGCFALLFGSNVLTGVGLMMSPDISRLLNGQNETIFAAYEDRISQLRMEVDRLQSRSYAQAGDINLQLQDITIQQQLLTEQHQFVRALVDAADEVGLVALETEPPTTDTVSAISPPLNREGEDGSVEARAAEIETMLVESRLALASLSQAAQMRTKEIVSALETLGVTPDLPVPTGAGGPLEPVAGQVVSPDIVSDANAVMEALLRFKAAKAAIDDTPVHRPLSGNPRISSPFGARSDPFGAGAAFHAGLDFPAPTGTLVLSAAAGTVSFVGEKSGYGNVVEVTHEDGLVTRYGHLSGFLSHEGQAVEAGTPIAKVGSTGRSTGPHLHFEVRRSDQALNPSTFLSVGDRLARFISQS